MDRTLILGLVGDGIQYADTDKSAGYTVVEGDKEASVVLTREEIRQMQRNARITGRKRQVKKNRGDIRMMNRLTT